jgi:phosphoglycerol transferase MdoB-like AlkP superfamily enzyme
VQSLALPHWVWAVVMITVTIAAVWKGGPSERVGALIYFGAWILTMIARSDQRHYPQLGEFAVDVVTLILLIVLALRSHRYWPIGMAAMQALVAATHAGRLIDPQLSSWAYYTSLQMWGYLVLVLLAVATWRRWRENSEKSPLARTKI